MGKFKKIMALFMVMILAAAMLGACGKSESNDTTGNVANTNDNATVTDVAENEDMAEINVMVMSLGPMGDGKNAVEDAVNTITEKEINTHVTLTYVEVGSYAQQLSLAITGNEKVDLCLLTPIPTASFNTLVAQNQLVPLNDLLTQYAPETLGVIGELVKGTTVNGNTYALPVYRDLSSYGYITARKDLVEAAGQLDSFNNMKTWTDFENIMKAVTAKNDIAGISNGDTAGNVMILGGADFSSDNFAENYTFDTLGDSSKVIYCDENGKVMNLFETTAYKQMIDRVRQWYQEDLVYKDAPTSKETADSLLKSNVTFSNVCMGETNIAANKSALVGHEMIVKQVTPFMLNTAATTKFAWGVPVCAKEQEAAVKFLNLMYTNKDIMNTLCWGIEGRDYVVTDGVANFPEGVTMDNAAYHSSDFLWGNSFIAYPWDSAADEREVSKANTDSMPVSPFLGFSCDTSNISNELTAISNVVSEYAPGLESGTTDNYDEFIKKLKDVGVDKLVAEYQTQLDAWRDAQ